ncbi:ketoacyl-ACP synthase III [Streptomyces antimycoticus]|uniref:3-oxoacyl-ACP synthase III family protein n=1 Tax=Streptomyces antimycoticus TaxID=68175 RepID=UPI000A3A38D3
MPSLRNRQATRAPHTAQPQEATDVTGRVGILGTGSYVPDRVVTNAEVGAPAGVDDAWITRKTGIRSRRWADDKEATSDLALAAARAALQQAGVTPDQLSLIVVATSTPDSPQPPTAALLAALVDAPPSAAAFDINAVCSGFMFAVNVARHSLAHTGSGYALVIGADVYSRFIDPLDRRTVVLLADGAGAVVLGPERQAQQVLDTRTLSYGEFKELVKVPAGGSRLPASADTVAQRQHYFAMQGRAVTEFVRTCIPPAVEAFLKDNGLTPDDIDHVITHQANGHLIRTLADDLGLRDAALHTTVERYGNTGAASVPVTLDDAVRAGKFTPGETVLLVAFGGGMSIGLGLLRW